MFIQSSFVFCIIFTIFVDGDEYCTTPTGNVGACVSLLECPRVLSALANPKREALGNLDKYFCSKSGKRDKVCCDVVNYRNVHEPFLRVNTSNKLMSHLYCGLQHTDDYVHPENEVSIDEFPWLALILLKVFDKGQMHVFPICTGTLINNKYVLTSNDCVSKHSESSLTVHLGKFNIENKTMADCVEHMSYNVTECSDSEEFEVGKLILHPYRVAYTYNNDLALLKLARNVIFSDYIRPVCLPTFETKFAEIGDRLYVTGWNDQFFVKGKPTKKKVSTVLLSNERCSSMLRTTITGYNICTIGYSNNTEAQCYLDKGGPLMFANRDRWHLEGILSEFSGRCDNSGPLIFMRTSQYLEWIYDNVGQ
ncbi:hypothetical protein FQA39_LY13371 [Lamprigera yunnana]|nr:hypothetical protein FQA39_LY13371 [Lamprigera yunnana]